MSLLGPAVWIELSARVVRGSSSCLLDHGFDGENRNAEGREIAVVVHQAG